MNEANRQKQAMIITKALAGGGEMGERIRAFDWSKTPLGAISSWPQSLVTSVSLMLNSQHPIWIGWGPDNTFLYNDPYITVLSQSKHPWALGRPTSEVWAEIWNICGPLSDKVYRCGEASFANDVQLFMSRGDFLEETFYSFSYSPIRNESGHVGGLFCPSAETTAKILSARRLASLSDLTSKALSTQSLASTCASMAETLSRNSSDIPFALIYLTDMASHTAALTEAVGISAGLAEISPLEIKLDHHAAELTPWQFSEVIKQAAPQIIDVKHLHALPLGLAGQHISQTIVLPLKLAAQDSPIGLLVAGINPCRKLDGDYRTFFDLIAAQIAGAIQNARTHEDEKRRADQLAEINRAKTHFFTSISHELRTPLTLMLGPLEETIKHPQIFGSGVQNELEMAHRNGLRLLKLINTLLDFSRIEACRAQPVYEKVDLSAFTTDLASSFRSAFEKAGLIYEVYCSPLSSAVYVDRHMWEKIVLNLLSNALKFTFKGKVSLSLCENEGQVVLDVTDTGGGIPAHEIPRLFERFYRVEGIYGRTHEGSGIGLALVQELVKLHSGTISVKSLLNQGSSFTITLPTGRGHLPSDRIQAVASEPATAKTNAYSEEALQWTAPLKQSFQRLDPAALSKAASSSASPTSLQLKTAGARILLADDNADMLDYISRLLGQTWTVDTARDGLEALVKAKADPPDLILIDIMMPHLDGFGLLKELRADPRTSVLPIIMLSARAGEEATAEGIEAGADDYLVKPFHSRELIARVSIHIEMSRMRREAAQKEMHLLQEVKEAQESKLAILESISDHYIALNANGRISHVNKQVESFCDLSRKQIVGKTFLEVLPKFFGPKFYELYQQVSRHRQTISIEEYFAEKNLWYAIDLYPTSDHGLSIFFRDISARKVAEQILIEREDYFRTLVDCAPVMVWLTDMDGQTIFINERWHENTGQIFEDSLGMGWLNKLHPEDAHAAGELFLEASRLRKPFVHEYRLKHIDSSYKWVIDQGLPRFDKAGNFLGYIGAIVNIDERKYMEEALRESTQHLEVALGAARMGTYQWNIVANEIQCSNETKRLFGFDPDYNPSVPDMLGCIHPDDIKRRKDLMNQALENHEIYEIEYRIVAPNKAMRWVRSNGKAFYDQAGNPIRMSGAMLDITSRKNAESEREQLLASLMEADRRKDEFLAVLSHELRSPLNVIGGHIELLRMEGLTSADFLESLDVIERNTKAQTQLIADLLDVSRIITGKFTLDVSTFELAPILYAAVDAIRFGAEAKGIAIEIHVEPGISTFFGDLTRIQQLVWNLLVNAVKFTPQDGKITLSAHKLDKWIEISVADTGQGISPDFLPYVFERFHQEDASKTRKYGGLGLGLSIVRHIAELHGGSVAVKSLGKGFGSKFIITLPMKSLPQIPAKGECGKAEPPRLHDYPVKLFKQQKVLDGLDIMVIDDQQDAREMASKVLSRLGATVIEAASALRALELLANQKVDVLLCDIGMPDMSGIEFIKLLRQEERRLLLPLTPAIALTAYAGHQDKLDALEAGFQDHLGKPFKISELTRVTMEVCHRLKSIQKK